MNNAQSLALKIIDILRPVPHALIEKSVVKRPEINYSDGSLLVNLGNRVHFELYSWDRDNPVFSIDTTDAYSGKLDRNDHPLYDLDKPSDFKMGVKVWVNPLTNYYNWQSDMAARKIADGFVHDKTFLKDVNQIVRYSDAVETFKASDLDWANTTGKELKRIWQAQQADLY